MKKQNLLLPEWAFLEGTSHLGNTLEGRDVLLHVRTHTTFEFLNIDDNMVRLSEGVKHIQFIYTNKYGLEENYIVAVHWSLTSELDELDEVIQKAIQFFKRWMDWMDESIEVEDNSKIN